MSMAGRSGRKTETLGEFMKRQRNGRGTRERDGKKRKRGGRAAVIARVAAVIGCAALLLSMTVSGDLFHYFETAVSSGSRSDGSVIRLNGKPSFPGCTASAARKLSAEKIAAAVRPCVVGIVQYQKDAVHESGEGSGIVLSKNGLILTNNHVVEGAKKLVTVLSNGKKYETTVIGTDARTDIAVVKISADGLTCAAFGNSDQCSVGEQVVAIGNPSGLKLAGSVTQGIISAVNRNVDVGNGPMNLIQTDAAINPGNSGGALVNMYGQVIGVNSAKIVQQGYEGIGFSIPVNTVKPVVDSLIRYGYVKGRVRFGFSCREVDEVAARLDNIPLGIYIDSVDTAGPAAKCGIAAGDILVAIDGKKIETTDALLSVRDSHNPGERIRVTVSRGGKTLDFTLTLEEDRGDRQTMAAAGW